MFKKIVISLIVLFPVSLIGLYGAYLNYYRQWERVVHGDAIFDASASDAVGAINKIINGYQDHNMQVPGTMSEIMKAAATQVGMQAFLCPLSGDPIIFNPDLNEWTSYPQVVIACISPRSFVHREFRERVYYAVDTAGQVHILQEAQLPSWYKDKFTIDHSK